MIDHEDAIFARGRGIEAYAQAVTEGMVDPRSMSLVQFMNTVDAGSPQVPMTFEQQYRQLPPTEERLVLLRELEEEVVGVLRKSRVHIYESSSRLKTEVSIANKVKRFRKDLANPPLPDIFGVRCVIGHAGDFPSWELRDYYKVPENYFFGYEGYFKYVRKEDGRILYDAQHLIVPFGKKRKKHLAEIQLMTPAELRIANESREWYEQRKLQK